MHEPLLKKDFDKSINLSRRKQGKRKIATENTCKVELKREIQLLFNAFYMALNKTNTVLSSINPIYRSRNLEASVMQSSLAETLSYIFGENVFFGKYKRLILRFNGYIVLFKKLNREGKPMNIITTNVQSILNQNQVLDLFENSDYNDDPIVYFGYKKNKLGQFVDPQLVYIDDGKISFTITEKDMDILYPVNSDKSNEKPLEVVPTLKENNNLKQVI